MAIGYHVRIARKAEDLSQEGLARRADVSLNVVSRLERGEIADPHTSTLRRIARALGVPIDSLLGEPSTRPVGKDLIYRMSVRESVGADLDLRWDVEAAIRESNVVMLELARQGASSKAVGEAVERIFEQHQRAAL